MLLEKLLTLAEISPPHMLSYFPIQPAGTRWIWAAGCQTGTLALQNVVHLKISWTRVNARTGKPGQHASCV